MGEHTSVLYEVHSISGPTLGYGVIFNCLKTIVNLEPLDEGSYVFDAFGVVG